VRQSNTACFKLSREKKEKEKKRTSSDILNECVLNRIEVGKLEAMALTMISLETGLSGFLYSPPFPPDVIGRVYSIRNH